MVSPNSRYMTMVRLHSLEELDSLPLTKWNIRQHGDDEHLEDAMQTGESHLMFAIIFSLSLSFPLFFSLSFSFFLISGSLVTFSLTLRKLSFRRLRFNHNSRVSIYKIRTPARFGARLL